MVSIQPRFLALLTRILYTAGRHSDMFGDLRPGEALGAKPLDPLSARHRPKATNTVGPHGDTLPLQVVVDRARSHAEHGGDLAKAAASLVQRNDLGDVETFAGCHEREA